MFDVRASDFVRIGGDNTLLGISSLLLKQFCDSEEIIHLLER